MMPTSRATPAPTGLWLLAKQAMGIGLDDGNDKFVGTQAVTREEACLYAFTP